MRRLILYILMLLFSMSLMAQKKEHAEFLKSIESENLKSLSAGCQMGRSVTEISLNNVRTYLYTDGNLWYNYEDNSAGYEIPKGSGKTSIYSGGFWIGGNDIYGNMKISATHFKGSRNFWPGPLITSGEEAGSTDYEICYQYDRHFQISRQQVEAFRDWYNTPDEAKTETFGAYSIPDAILSWPAHSDVAAGYDYYLAPFWDNNDDGTYDPYDGDYPFFDLEGTLQCGTAREHDLSRLYGDQSTWWVYNDNGNLHRSPNGVGIGMEIRAQAFQFSTNDEINNMSFYNFQFINRSNISLFESFVGLYVDGDLGYRNDDRVGCHVSKGIGYFYNSDNFDGESGDEDRAYGTNPPAIGFDFFEGPYKDPNGMDDCSSYDRNDNLICNECILNGNINGINFGDGVVDNERLGLSRFMAYINNGGVGYGPLYFAGDYHKALQGRWNDNESLRYGGNAHPSGSSGPITYYMFPGNSDPCGYGQGGVTMPAWSDDSSENEKADRRFVQSSGPFTMEPGEVNDVTMGVIWARSFEGDRFASLDKMLEADDKAQALFDNCFRIVDGPDAPELTIQEQDNKLIFNIWNKPHSNNYLERYNEEDPYIVCPVNDPECDTHYRFQGYQVWQLKDHSSTLQDAINNNPDEARLVFQCDIRDGIGQIVNHEWDKNMQTNIPKIEVEGADQGISHSFVVEEDLFAKGNTHLVNFKDYYYVAIAYAHNDYQTYNQSDPSTIGGQKKPYKAGRKGADGSISIYKATPNNTYPQAMRIGFSGYYGESTEITQIEGHGSGSNILDLSKESIDSIMSGPPWKVDHIEYEQGKGPIEVKIIDPNNIVNDQYTLKFDSVDYFRGIKMNGKIVDANWYVYNSKGDTVFSESMISSNYDQLILEWGLSINVTQEQIPYQMGAINNGFLEATMEFEDPAVPWLSFISDDDRNSPRNWIRAGYTGSDYSGDAEAVYEKILGGTWAPFKQAYLGTNGVSYDRALAAINTNKQRLASVDIYFTPDRSKWTRSPVIETTDDETLSKGNAEKFELRADQSVDKWGRMAEDGIGSDSINVDAASYISETGMGWFPGYAIDVNTGERLNIVYGESSWLTGDNGSDMMWNPSTREGSKIYKEKQGIDVDPLEVFFGGKHFIYIMGHNQNMRIDRDADYMPSYDAGKFFMEKISGTDRYKLRELFKNAMWCAIPMLNPDVFDEDDIKDDPYGFVRNELKIRLRVVNQYSVDIYDHAIPDSLSLNNNKPMYSFDIQGWIGPGTDPNLPQRLLDMINVVPNPYYGSSGYTNPDYEYGVKIINLPSPCTISIYSLSGNLLRRIKNDDRSSTYIHWDLNNDYGIPVASGIYLIHVNAPGLGEKVLKWMGAIR